jgi:hypothetical protein
LDYTTPGSHDGGGHTVIVLQVFVGGVDDGLDLLPGYVTLDNRHGRSADSLHCYGFHNASLRRSQTCDTLEAVGNRIR